MPAKSNNWTYMGREQVKLQFEGVRGHHTHYVGGQVHLWRTGIPNGMLCGRKARHVNRTLPTVTLKVCLDCLHAFQQQVQDMLGAPTTDTAVDRIFKESP